MRHTISIIFLLFSLSFLVQNARASVFASVQGVVHDPSHRPVADAQLTFGDRTEKTAWYASLNGSRSDYGPETPVPQIFHDATNSESGFASVIRNQTSKDQTRVDGQLRQDYFDVPYDPDTTFDVAGGHTFGERLKFTGTIINATNHRVLQDNSVTIGGFHYNDPRIFQAALSYLFKF